MGKYSVDTGVISGPQKLVVYGPEGVGKTTLLSNMPDPLFIDTEGSTKNLNVKRLPVPADWQMLIDMVNDVANNPRDYGCKTLCIDTLDWAEQMAIGHVLIKNGKKGIEDFGYGKGYTYLAEAESNLLKALDKVIAAGINVAAAAHAKQRKIEQPEETGSYDHWELKLSKQFGPMVKEWADMLLFCNYKINVINVDGQGAQKGKNKATGGKRIIHTTHTPWWDAKNRHTLADELPMDFAAISHCFTNSTTAKTKTEKSEKPKKPDKPELKQKEPEPSEEKQEVVFDITQLQMPDTSDLPKELADLMLTNIVYPDEIQAVVAERGYYPADTPLQKYDPQFIEGVLVGAWPQMFAMIEQKRQQQIPF